MNLSDYLNNSGYHEELGERLTVDLIDDIVDIVGNSIIDKNCAQEYSKQHAQHKIQLNGLLAFKDSIDELTKSYTDLFDRVNNASTAGQLDKLNKELSTTELELANTDKQLKLYLTLSKICEFLDQNDKRITLSNIDRCFNFKKTVLHEELVLSENSTIEECALLTKRYKNFEKNVSHFLVHYFVQNIRFSKNHPILITIVRQDHDEFFKFLDYLVNIGEYESLIAQLSDKLAEFWKVLLNHPKKVPRIVDESDDSVSLILEDTKVSPRGKINLANIDDSNGEMPDSVIDNLGVFVEFVHKHFPMFDQQIQIVEDKNMMLFDLKKKFLFRLLQSIPQKNLYGKLNNLCNALRDRLENTPIGTAIDFIHNLSETENKLIDHCQAEAELGNSIDVDLLDRTRLLFASDNLFLSITKIQKSKFLNQFWSSDDLENSSVSCEDVPEVDHPEFWKNLLDHSILLGEYSSSIEIHEFVYKFILLAAEFYFSEQTRESKFGILRNVYKLFCFMVKQKLCEYKDLISSFAFFYNDLQILNYFTVALNMSLLSEIPHATEPLYSFGDYMIDLDDSFSRVIESVMSRTNNLLLNSANQLELHYMSLNVQKRNSLTAQQIRDCFREFSFVHKTIVPKLVLEKYIGALSNNIAEVIALKITNLSDIPEKNITPIVDLVNDIIDCFTVYGLDICSNEKLSPIPAVIRLQYITTILKSNLCTIAQMWSVSSTETPGDHNLRNYLTREQLIKLIESIFQQSTIRTDVIDKIRYE